MKLKSLYNNVEQFSTKDLSNEQIVNKIASSHNLDTQVAEIISAAFFEARDEANKIMMRPKAKVTKTGAKTKADLKTIVATFKANLRRLCRNSEIDFAGIGWKVIWSSTGKGLSKPFSFATTAKLATLISAHDIRQSFNYAIDGRSRDGGTENQMEISRRYDPELLHEKVQNFFRSLKPSMELKFGRVDVMRKHGYLISGLPNKYEQNKPISAQKRSVLRKCLKPTFRSQIKIREVDEESVEVASDNVLQVVLKSADSTALMMTEQNRLELLKKARKLRRLHSEIKVAEAKYAAT